MRSLRNDSLSCLVLNCLVVSVMIVLMSLTLHSPAPIVKYSSHQKLSLPSRPSLYQFIDEPTLKTLLNVSLFSFQEHVSQPTSPNKILPVLEVNGVTIAHLSNAKAVNYTHQSDPPNKEAVNKGIGGGHHLAEETSQVLENNELLAQHKPPYDIESLGSNRQLSQEHSVPGASSAAPNNRPYVVKKPLLHISSKRKLSSQNIISKDFLPQQPTQSVNWTKQTLDALKSRNTVVDDTDNQFSSKHDILPLVAFIDTRQRYNHKNSTAILVQVRDVKRIRYNRIIGCGIDNIKAKSFKAKPLFVYRNWIHSNVPNLTHSEAIVNCYDLPSVNGSKPYLLYRPFRAPGLLKIYSERPVMVTPGTMKPLSVVVCSTVYDQPPWLAHWLRYQETLGVDHIHLYAQQSFVDKGGLEEPEVKRLIMNGRLVVDLRSTHLTNSQVYYYSQPLYYQDCLLRYRGIYDFAILIDTDDFFVPRVPAQQRIHYYLEQLFPDTARLASIALDWIRYFPSCGFRTPLNQITNGNLTHHLSTYRGYQEYVKSIHRLELVTEAAVHEVTYIVAGYKNGFASNSTAYFAHIRKTDSCPTNLTDVFYTDNRKL